MQVDNPLQSQYSFNSAFEDFFNMEMLGGSSNHHNSGTGSSSTSPRAAFSVLPPTPPHNIDSFFNFYLEDDLVKSDNLAPPPASTFDFFAALTNNNFSSPSSGSGSSPEEVATPSVLAIDPQLVGTPSAPKSHSDIDEEENHTNLDVIDITLSEDPTEIAPYKVGGKGNSNRKGTVQGGGVVKKTSVIKEKVVSSPQSSVEDALNKDSDDWRPSPEEYKKMSSKEKRQLRNKISARNFRVRRKEYITTLETDIAERDRLIDAIRGELGSTKSENSALRQEIDALKKALLQGQPTPVLPPPAPLPTVSAAASVAARNSTTPSSPLLAPNTNKDLPSSPRLAATRGGFWGGQGSSTFGTMGGFTPVHTTLVPEWSLSALAGKGLITPPESPPMNAPSPPLQENINPAMNNSSQPPLKHQTPNANLQNTTPFDSFTDMNPFTMKTLDMYRMHLWTRLAQQQNQQRQQANSQQSSLNGLAAGLRPHYFTATDKQPLASSNSSTSLSRLLSGKTVPGSYPIPPSSPHLGSTLETPMRATAQEAALATLASQTLIGKLGSAFWEAFAGQSSTPSSSRKGIDANKIQKVLEGKAVVKVVDIDEPPILRLSPSMKVIPSSPRPTSPKMPETKEKLKCCNCNVTEILEEGMRSLSISKRGAS